MNKLQILVGPIASGKSTYAKLMAIEGYITVNDDAIITALHGSDYRLYSKDLKPLYKNLETTIVCYSAALFKNVIVDRGVNISAKGRRRFIGMAHSLDMTCEAIVFDRHKPEIHAQRRFQYDNRGHSYEYWLEVAQEHDSKYEEATLDEGFDSIIPAKWALKFKNETTNTINSALHTLELLQELENPNDVKSKLQIEGYSPHDLKRVSELIEEIHSELCSTSKDLKTGCV